MIEPCTPCSRACVVLLLVMFTATSKAESVSRSNLPDSLWEGNDRVRSVLMPTTDFSSAEKFELRQGGAGTQQVKADRNAYSMETSTLSFEGLQRFKLGNALFNKFWVASPSSTQASDGLGPFYNARACQSCHIKDGRGQLPVAGEKTASLLLQLKNESNDWGPDSAYGGQFHTSAVPGIDAEGLVAIVYEDKPVALEGEDSIVLRQPWYRLQNTAYGNLDPDTRLSPRLAPAQTV